MREEQNFSNAVIEKPADGFSSFELLTPKLQVTYENAFRYFEQQKANDNPDWIVQNEAYAEHDLESYDCHTFMAAVARREFGAEGIPSLTFQTPERNDYEYETDWLVELGERVKASPEHNEEREVMRKVTEAIYENSEHIPIPEITCVEDDNGRETLGSSWLREKLVSQVVEDVLASLRDSPSSRILLVSNGKGEEFYDVHSSIVLGIEEGGKDLLLLEKEEIGSPVIVCRLSSMIERHALYYSSPDLEISICKKSIKEVVKESLQA